jgi:hypothetical protein
MSNENETKIRDLAGRNGTKNPAKSPAGVAITFRRQGHNQEEPTHLYALECAGRVKIGIASNVENRVANLQMACPVKIEVAHTRLFPSRVRARMAERFLHSQFAEMRSWGEWFDLKVSVAIEAINAAPDEAPAVVFQRPVKVIEVRPVKERPTPTWQGNSLTAADFDAMTDDEWCEHFRPIVASALNFDDEAA